jgi:amidohydrolase
LRITDEDSMTKPRSSLAWALPMGLLVSSMACAAPDPADIDAAIGRVLPEIVAVRQQIHANPELGNREVETAALVAERLRRLGFDEVRTGIAHTGVVGVLRGTGPGPVVAIRADMDALPVTEATDLPFRSTRRATWLGEEVGVMHACGHDIHTAVVLGVASVLAGLRDSFNGTVMFVFQPAEEGPPPGEEGGAKLMLDEGVFTDMRPDVIFGLHAAAQMPVGQVGYIVGGAFAAVDHFYVTLTGRQSHGAEPNRSVDPVVMAAEAISALQTIRSRNLDPMEPGVVTIGIVRGGNRFNIIPAEVELEGTVRTFSAEAQDLVERRMREILDGITTAAGGSHQLRYDRLLPVLTNDAGIVERMIPTLVRTLGESNVRSGVRWMGGDDFAFFAQRVPALYLHVGTLASGTTSGNLHTPTYRGDDGSIEVGMRSMITMIVDYIRGS